MDTGERLGQVMQKVAGGKLTETQCKRLGTWAVDTFDACDIRKIVCPPEYEALGIAQLFLGGTRKECSRWSLRFIYNGKRSELYWNGRKDQHRDCLMWTIYEQAIGGLSLHSYSFKTLGDVINHLVERYHND